jgi:hypothetical protein
MQSRMEECVIRNAMIAAFYYSEIRHIILSIFSSNLLKELFNKQTVIIT